jgi:hypothetical protein
LSNGIRPEAASQPEPDSQVKAGSPDSCDAVSISQIDPAAVTLIALAHQSGGHDIWATVIVVVTLLAMPVASVWFLWRSDDDSDDSDDDGGFGGPPPDPPPSPEPPWWPDFERDFAAHVRSIGAVSRR